LLGLALHALGQLPEPPTVAQLHGELYLEEQNVAMKRQALDETPQEAQLVAHFHRLAMYRGSDVRLTTGDLLNPAAWPRRGVDPSCWRWRVVMSYPRTGSHINILELYAVFMALKWRLGCAASLGRRCLHLCDSQVCIAVLTKGRSSSTAIMRILRRINALLLASFCLMCWAYVGTDVNPADPPSRWHQK